MLTQPRYVNDDWSSRPLLSRPAVAGDLATKQSIWPKQKGSGSQVPDTSWYILAIYSLCIFCTHRTVSPLQLSLVSLPPAAIFKPHHTQWHRGSQWHISSLGEEEEAKMCLDIQLKTIWSGVLHLHSRNFALLKHRGQRVINVSIRQDQILALISNWLKPPHTWLTLTEQMMSRHWLTLSPSALDHTRQVMQSIW